MMNTSLTSTPACLSAQQLSRAEDQVLLELYQQAIADRNQALNVLIQAEVVRRIRFDLLGSVSVYNAFMAAAACRQPA